MNSLLSILLEEFQDKIHHLTTGVKRNIILPTIANKIIVAIGMRRTGKTHFLLQKIKSLLDEKISLSRILYLNFEDDRLYPMEQQKLSTLLEGFYTLYPENHEQRCYFFLDEIQNVIDWQRVIRRYLDTKNVALYLTGSSAKLLSKEIASTLRGRSLAIEIWPFSFSENLTAKGIQLPEKPIGKRTLDTLQKQLREYLHHGGFPELINLPDIERVRILQDYVDVVIFRDIIERHNITNITLIKYMIKSLLRQVGGSFTVNKFVNDLKSQGFKVGKSTVYDYLNYIEDTYLAFAMPLYSESVRKTQTNPRKIYAIDPGLVNAYTFSFSKNLGHLFENLVFLDLKRLGYEVYYYLTESTPERYEVDFLTRDLKGQWRLYQVVWDNHDTATMERETRALEAAEKELGIKGKMITPLSYINDSWFI